MRHLSGPRRQNSKPRVWRNSCPGKARNTMGASINFLQNKQLFKGLQRIHSVCIYFYMQIYVLHTDLYIYVSIFTTCTETHAQHPVLENYSRLENQSLSLKVRLLNLNIHFQKPGGLISDKQLTTPGRLLVNKFPLNKQHRLTESTSTQIPKVPIKDFKHKTLF